MGIWSEKIFSASSSRLNFSNPDRQTCEIFFALRKDFCVLGADVSVSAF